MLFADRDIIPPKEWNHDPLIKNVNGQTIALILAGSGIIPPKEWEHDKFIKDKYNKTVA